MRKALFLLVLAGCSGRVPAPQAGSLELFRLADPPEVGRTSGGQGVRLGGLSGLCLLTASEGQLEFLSHTDRGPNPDPIALKGGGKGRTFLLPKFQPRLVRLVADRASLSLRVTAQIGLHERGKAVTGIPFGKKPMPEGFTTEAPVTASGEPIPFDGRGIDPEGLSCSALGDLWMVEEYGPALLRVSREGEIKERFIPRGGRLAGLVGTEALPRSLARRRLNRGLEGVAESDGRVFLFLQSALVESERWIPIYEFDPIAKKVVAEFRLPLEPGKSDKIGDAVALGGRKFLVLEQDSGTGASSFHRLFEVDLSVASGPPTKRLVLDLVAAGYDFAEKVEGIALVDSSTIAVLNDDDFGVGVTPGSSIGASVLGLVKLPQPLVQ